MGSSNLNCAISDFPINDGEEVMCIPLIANEDNTPFYVYGQYEVAGLPFQVEMGDYACPLNIFDESFGQNKKGEIITINEYDELIYRNFRDHICEPIIDAATGKQTLRAYDEPDWYIKSHRRFEEFKIGYNCFFDGRPPVYSMKTERVDYMYINMEVYKLLTKYTEEHKEFLARYVDGIYEDAAREDFFMGERAGISYSIMRFLFAKYISKKRSDEANSYLRQRLIELNILFYNMESIQKQLKPSSHMSPQGGWYSTDDEQRNFLVNLIAIYDARQMSLQN